MPTLFKRIKLNVKRLMFALRLNWVIDLAKYMPVLISKLILRKGLKKKIGDIGKIYVSFNLRQESLPTQIESDWWARLINEIRPQDTIADVGAYIGIFTVLLAKKTGPNGKVLAFEPNPKSLALLKENVRINGVSQQVEYYNFAIGKGPGQLLLVNEAATSHIVSSDKESNCFSVKSSSLDALIGDRKIDLIKIDVEGYENNVIYGARDLLRKKDAPRFIWIECHPYLKEAGFNSTEIKAQLEDAGYAIEVPALPPDKELDGLDHHWVMFASRL